MGKINRKDLVDRLSEELHLSKKESREIFDATIDYIVEALHNGQEVNISGFGVLTPKTRKTRVGTDPKTHNKIQIKSATTILFRPSKEFKEKLNK